jgi:phosphatidylinositol glycan class B
LPALMRGHRQRGFVHNPSSLAYRARSNGFMLEMLRPHSLPRSNSTTRRAALLRSPGLSLALILGIAFLLRVAAIFSFPSLNHPDENFQLFEQAHRLAFGYGIKPWEFEDGIRSLVPPYLLGRLFALAEPIFGAPQGYIDAARILLAALSLAYVAAVYRMGLRSSRTHALIGGLVAASWFELVYFSYRPLTEGLACDLLVIALACASHPPEALTHRHLATIGFCLAASLMLRVHLIAGILFAALYVGRLDFRNRWLPLIIGGIPPVLLFGAVDWLVWGSPFHSYIQAFWINLVQGKSAEFGTGPLYWYFERIYAVWFCVLPILLLLIGLRARASALWIGVACAIIASHSLIPHKEYRYIFPALACLIIVASMGSADLVKWLSEQMGPRVANYLTVGCGALWLLASAMLASRPAFAQNWLRSRDFIEASFWLSAQPDLCGLLFYDDSWIPTGGYAHLHRNIPIYALMRDRDLAMRTTEAYNFVLLRRASAADFQPQFWLVHCDAEGAPNDLCIARRAGVCRRLLRLVPLLEQNRLGAQAGD